MNSLQIESWALRVIDRVKNGHPNEDSLVELKAEWIEPDKAARRIAGHANAARGEKILWLIGVDEKKCTVPGAIPTELANWYAAVESEFNEGIAPRMTPLNITINGVTVVALIFETDRAPFVVRNPAFGKEKGESVELEVPWRENTRIRSARRSDLIRLLSPLELLPDVEVIKTELNLDKYSNDGEEYFVLELYSELYIVPKTRDRVVIPFHRCKVTFEISEIPMLEAVSIRLSPAPGWMLNKPGSLTIQSTVHETIIDGPGKISLKAETKIPSLANEKNRTEVRVSIYLMPTHSERPIILEQSIPYPAEYKN